MTLSLVPYRFAVGIGFVAPGGRDRITAISALEILFCHFDLLEPVRAIALRYVVILVRFNEQSKRFLQKNENNFN